MNWYIYGETALDRLLHCDRADEAWIWFSTDKPPRQAALSALNLPDSRSIAFTNQQPTVYCTLDRYVLLPTGALWDVLKQGQVDPPAQLLLELLQPDLPPREIIRLYRLSQRYPEVICSRELAGRLKAELAYFVSVQNVFSDLKLLLLQFEVA
jgi:hypothetical protein